MLKKVSDNIYKFNAGTKTISVEILKDNVIEVYEDRDPYRTGFIFDDFKQMVSTVNNLADVAEAIMEEQKLWKWLKSLSLF